MGQKDSDILSTRQRQCLEGVAEHLDSAQIAARLGISPHTVDGHIAVAVATLGARSRRDAVRLWRERDEGGADGHTGEKLTDEFSPVDFPPRQPADHGRSVVKEIDASPSFVIGPDRPIDRQGRPNERPDGALIRLATLAVIAAALVIILLAAPQLGHGAQSLANLIQPYRQHR